MHYFAFVLFLFRFVLFVYVFIFCCFFSSPGVFLFTTNMNTNHLSAGMCQMYFFLFILLLFFILFCFCFNYEFVLHYQNVNLPDIMIIFCGHLFSFHKSTAQVFLLPCTWDWWGGEYIGYHQSPSHFQYSITIMSMVHNIQYWK